MKTLNYIVCTLLLIFVVSCITSKNELVPPQNPDKSKVTTTINVYTDEAGNVVLSNNGNAKVMPNTYVQWNVIDPQIRRIRNIAHKQNSNDIIWVTDQNPRASNNSRKYWRGLVFTPPNKDKYEYHYFLEWEKQDGTYDTIDPVIQVDPDPGS